MGTRESGISNLILWDPCGFQSKASFFKRAIKMYLKKGMSIKSLYCSVELILWVLCGISSSNRIRCLLDYVMLKLNQSCCANSI